METNKQNTDLKLSEIIEQLHKVDKKIIENDNLKLEKKKMIEKIEVLGKQNFVLQEKNVTLESQNRELTEHLDAIANFIRGLRQNKNNMYGNIEYVIDPSGVVKKKKNNWRN